MFRRIVRPSRVPLRAGAGSILLYVPYGRQPYDEFLDSRRDSVVPSGGCYVRVLGRFGDLRVLVSTVFVYSPFSVLLAVVGVGRKDGDVRAGSICITLLRPMGNVYGRRILGLQTSMVVGLNAPIQVFSLSQVYILVRYNSIGIHGAVDVFQGVYECPIGSGSGLVLVWVVRRVLRVLQHSVSKDQYVVSNRLVSPKAIGEVLYSSRGLCVNVSRFLRVDYRNVYRFSVIVGSFFVFL